jgi:hypothetical protein
MESGFATVPQEQGLADIDAAIAAERRAMQKQATGNSVKARQTT